MKKNILILIFIVSYSFSQSIVNKLGGNSASESYDVMDSSNNVLLRVRGDGKVGVGVAVPVEKLHINGNLVVKDGSEGTGKVLTSDANGVGTWQPSIVGPQGIKGDTGESASFEIHGVSEWFFGSNSVTIDGLLEIDGKTGSITDDYKLVLYNTKDANIIVYADSKTNANVHYLVPIRKGVTYTLTKIGSWNESEWSLKYYRLN